MLVYMFAFSLLAAIGRHFGVDRFYLAPVGSVITSALISSLNRPRFCGGFHDEALSGKWKGHRSSRLGLQWRVIYQVVADVLLIQVVQVTAHDYRRP